MSTENPEHPALHIVRGTPTPEELAVVTALVTAAASGGTPPAEPATRGRWSDPSARVRRTWRPGPGAWRAAGR